MRKKVLLLCFWLAVSWLYGQNFDARARLQEAKARALAVRAARIDALRQLGEIIKGVRLNSRTTVKDFVTESDMIETRFAGFLQGAQQQGNAKIYDDGTVEITMSMHRDAVVSGLRTLARQSHSVSPGNITLNYDSDKFLATGTGAMSLMPSPPSTIDIWRYVGIRGKLMAKRAAQVDAYRNIGEMLYGIKLDSQTTVKDFVAESDVIRGAFNNIVRGVQVDRRVIYRPDGIVEMNASLDVDSLIGFLSRMAPYARTKVGNLQLDAIRSSYPQGVIKTTGMGVPPARYVLSSPRYPAIAAEPPYERVPGAYVPQQSIVQRDENAIDPNPKNPWQETEDASGEITSEPQVSEPQNPDTWVVEKPDPKPIAPQIAAPPTPPSISVNPFVRPPMPPLPKVPERFVPEWAKRYITVTGTGVYPEGMEIGQGLAMARRAAQVDAYRLLAENALGVKLQSATTVQDFVTQKDQIRARVDDAFIRGAETVTDRDFRDERYFEVDMKLYLGYMWEIIDAAYNKELISQYGQKLESNQPDYMRYQSEIKKYQNKLDTYQNKYLEYEKQLSAYYAQNSSNLALDYPQAKTYQQQYRQYQSTIAEYKSNHQQYAAQLQKFQQQLQDYLAQYKKFQSQYQKLYARYGREASVALMPGPPIAPTLAFTVPTVRDMPALPQVPQRFVPQWAEKHITAKGTGAYAKNMPEAQAMAMARRAAQVDAYRLLVENAMGVHLKSQTTIKDFLAEKDTMTARVKDSFLRGAETIHSKDFPQDRYYEVTMKLYLGYMWEIIDAEYNKVLIEKYGKKLEDYQPDQVRYNNEMEMYREQLRKYKNKFIAYQKQLQSYYDQQSQNLALDHPVAKSYKSQYHKYQNQAQKFAQQYQQYQQALEKYRREQERRQAQYEKYRHQYQQMHTTYKNEAAVALIPPPPKPPMVAYSRPQPGELPALPKPPERFVPDWAKKHITATGMGVYPKNKPEAQAMALAKRAAQVDAYRLLVENAMGVHLRSETSVKDFLTQKDKMTARVKDSFLRGAQMVGGKDVRERRYYEVTMKLFLGDMWEIIDAEYNKVLLAKYGRKLEEFQPDQARFKTEMEVYRSQLQTYKSKVELYHRQLDDYYAKYSDKIALQHPVAKRYRQQYREYRNQSQSLKQQYQQYQQDIAHYQKKHQQQMDNYQRYNSNYQQTHAKYQQEAEIALIPAPPEPPALSFVGPQTENTTIPAPPQRFVPEWAKRYITATGTGVYPKNRPLPQAKLLAQRAAQVDAYRLLVENALGVRLKSKTSVKNFIAQKDTITAKVNNVFLRGAQVVDVKSFPRKRYCEVDMKLYLGDMWEIIDAEYNKVLMRQYGKKLEEFQPDQARYRTEMELYQARLRTYHNTKVTYKKQLEDYYAKYGSKIALNYALCVKHRTQYQEYSTQVQEYTKRLQEYKQQLEQYQQQQQQQQQDYQQYKQQYEQKYQAYTQESSQQ